MNFDNGFTYDSIETADKRNHREAQTGLNVE